MNAIASLNNPSLIIAGEPTFRASMPLRLLLVDDDQTQIKLCRLRLREEGFLVVTASNAEEALEKARGCRPDVIMSDVVMGGLDGFSLCRRVREDRELDGVPVILLSAHYGDEKDRELAARVGASALVMRTPDFSAELETLGRTLLEGAASADAPGAAVYEEQLRTTNKRLSMAVAEARRSEQRYRALFDNAADMISVLTPDGVIVEVNQRSQELLGVLPEEMIGRHVRDFATTGGEESHVAGYRKAVDKAQDRRVVPMQRPDGTVKYVEFSTNLIELNGEPRILSVGRDVTEKRRLEETLRQAQKMEAIGQLSGGIAHDFNNILAVIIANSHLLLDDLQESDPRREDVEQIRLAADRAAGLTRQLLAFSRKQVMEPTLVDLNTTIGGLEKMLQRLINEDVELSFVPESDLGTVRADVGQIEQVVMNLVVNARDAMPAGGKLTIETSNVDLDADYAAEHAGVPAGRYVMFAVSDTGCGMDAETKRRLFEPFFTTKDLGRGTGLGLSTCHGIVNQSGGSISVYSELGVGTVFKVYLPRVDGRPEPLRAPKSQSELRGTETVLLIEDDERVRTAVGRILRGYGYRVLAARHANEAIAIARRKDAGIDLVLSDMVIPGLSGPEAVSEIRKCWPHAKALFMSGYTDHAIFSDGGLETGAAFIQKPFAPESLAKKVRAVLDA
jgi:two-component system, cell cycle sensor histidine kinase and response regulator CckA